jgi:hypothetical protein
MAEHRAAHRRRCILELPDSRPPCMASRNHFITDRPIVSVVDYVRSWKGCAGACRQTKFDLTRTLGQIAGCRVIGSDALSACRFRRSAAARPAFRRRFAFRSDPLRARAADPVLHDFEAHCDAFVQVVVLIVENVRLVKEDVAPLCVADIPDPLSSCKALDSTVHLCSSAACAPARSGRENFMSLSSFWRSLPKPSSRCARSVCSHRTDTPPRQMLRT